MRSLAMMTKPIVQFDLALSNLILHHRFNRQVAGISRQVSRSGDGPGYLLLGLFVCWQDPRSGLVFFLTGLMAFLFELPIYWAVKNSFKRRRPSDKCPTLTAFITPSDRYSLPSGHTAAAFLMATLVSAYYPQFAFFSYVWAGLIGLSRMLLGVHFLTDVLLGAALGVASAYAALAAMGMG